MRDFDICDNLPTACVESPEIWSSRLDCFPIKDGSTFIFQHCHTWFPLVGKCDYWHEYCILSNVIRLRRPEKLLTCTEYVKLYVPCHVECWLPNCSCSCCLLTPRQKHSTYLMFILHAVYNIVGSYRFCTGSAPDKVVEWYFVISFGNSC